jgi:predicted transcriptional regulator
MYGASMNFSQAKKYIAFLIQSDLLANDGAFYSMTKKGLRFLELYDEVTDAIGNIHKGNSESK